MLRVEDEVGTTTFKEGAEIFGNTLKTGFRSAVSMCFQFAVLLQKKISCKLFSVCKIPLFLGIHHTIIQTTLKHEFSGQP